MSKHNIIMHESNEAAQYKTGLEGWVDRHGRFWGEDERMARYCGSTHHKCDDDCGTAVSNQRVRCDRCDLERETNDYNKMLKKKWDGKTPLFSQTRGEYIFDTQVDLDTDGETYEWLRLVICEPNHYHELSDDYYEDILGEDQETSHTIMMAIEAFNKVVATCGPASWSPGKYAVDVSDW